MRPTIVKLGGSAITVKSRRCTPNLTVIESSIRQIAEFSGPLILLHGGGSFAHPFVMRAGLQHGYKGSAQLKAASETELFLDQLTRIIGAGLLRHKKPFVPIRPMSFVSMRNGRISRAFLEPIEHALEIGLLPLLHGDLVFDSTRGLGILSADKLASFLGERFEAQRVLYGCDVDGIYSRDPKKSQRAVLIEQVTMKSYKPVMESLDNSGGYDATGGMLTKFLEAMKLARIGIETVIFDITERQLLEDALRGKQIKGTRFVPWNEPRTAWSQLGPQGFPRRAYT